MFLDNRRSVPTLKLDVEAFDCSSLASDLSEDNKTTATRTKITRRMFHSVARECCKRTCVQYYFTTNPLSERKNAIFYCFSSDLVSEKQEIHSNLRQNDWLFWDKRGRSDAMLLAQNQRGIKYYKMKVRLTPL